MNTTKSFFFLRASNFNQKVGALPKVLFTYHSNRANLEISLLQPPTKRRRTRTIMRDLRSVAQKLMHLGLKIRDRPEKLHHGILVEFLKAKKNYSPVN